MLKPEQAVLEKQLPDFAVDGLVRGYVKHTDSKGCFVWLTRDIIGRVLIKDVRQQRQTDSRRAAGGTAADDSFRPAEHGCAVLTTQRTMQI